MPKTKTTTAPATANDSAELREYQQMYSDAFDALEPVRSTWEEKEMVLLSRNPDHLSKTTKSQINDGRLSTIILERAARVMAQMPSGSYHALSEQNAGMAKLMGLVMDKYVLPNANNPQDHLTKFRMLDMYSMVYGSMPLLYDWQVTPSYTGPNSWLLSPYNVAYEPGKFTIPESNYAFVRSLVSLKWLRSQRQDDEGKGWNRQAVQYVLKRAEEAGSEDQTAKSQYRSFVERNRLPSAPVPVGDNAMVEIITMYESGKDGRWITFASDFDWVELRNIPNPHGNGKIPIILKHCFPLMDSMIGLGDVERGMTLQKAMNSLINLYMDAVKFSIFPPVKVVRDQLDDPSSILWEPGQKWKVKNQGAIELMQTSPQGLATFQSTYGFMISAMLNQNGTTDTARSEDIDPGMGKTPRALAMQAAREGARDSWDRHMMESVIEELYNNYIDLIVRKQTKPMPIYLFKKEIIGLRKQYKEDMYLERFSRKLFEDMPINEDGMGGTVKVQSDMLKGGAKTKPEDVKYHFFVDASSTQKHDQMAESQELDAIMMTLLKVGPQNLPNVNFGKLVEKWIKSKAIQDAEEIVLDEEEIQQKQMQSQGQAQQQQLTPDGLPVIEGVNSPQPPMLEPSMENMGMTAQDPEIQEFMRNLGGMA